jgi:hypothetical protein
MLFVRSKGSSSPDFESRARTLENIPHVLPEGYKVKAQTLYFWRRRRKAVRIPSSSMRERFQAKRSHPERLEVSDGFATLSKAKPETAGGHVVKQ